MNYHNITKDDMNNGEGLRTVLWVAGCSHHCVGCQNPITWDKNGGLPFTEEVKQELFEALDKSWIKGVTFSGGDPLFVHNRKTILELAKEIKEKFPKKDIWCYTGYKWEDVSKLEGIENIDVLVDGEFKIKQRDVSLHWVGSPNQRIIDVKKTIEKNEVVIYCDLR